MQQRSPMRFHPTTGRPFVGQFPRAGEYRSTQFSGFWLYNPWTGERRDQCDIEVDPHGKLITPPDEHLYVAGGLIYTPDVRRTPLPEVTSPVQLEHGSWYILVHKEYPRTRSWLRCVNCNTADEPLCKFEDGCASI